MAATCQGDPGLPEHFEFNWGQSNPPSPHWNRVNLFSKTIHMSMNRKIPAVPICSDGLGGTSLRSKWSLCIINSLKGCVCQCHYFRQRLGSMQYALSSRERLKSNSIGKVAPLPLHVFCIFKTGNRNRKPWRTGNTVWSHRK